MGITVLSEDLDSALVPAKASSVVVSESAFSIRIGSASGSERRDVRQGVGSAAANDGHDGQPGQA